MHVGDNLFDFAYEITTFNERDIATCSILPIGYGVTSVTLFSLFSYYCPMVWLSTTDYYYLLHMTTLRSWSTIAEN